MSVTRFGVTHPVPVNLLMATLLIAGILAAVTLRREFFPEIEPEQASIALPYPGATPEEIEETLVRKVEDQLIDMDEVESLRTSISEGGGGIIVDFREGTGDVGELVDEIERDLDTLQDLPDESERIVVSEFKPRLQAIMISVFGDVDEDVLKRLIHEIRDDLRKLPRMGEVLISGVRDYEIRVDVDSVALLQHGLSLPQVAATIRSWMADVPGGTVRDEMGSVTVRTLGVGEQATAIEQIVVRASDDGQSLRVGDIAEVRESFVDEQLVTRFNGEPSATITVFKLSGQDVVAMAEVVRAYAAGRQRAEFPGSRVDSLIKAANWQAYEVGHRSPALPIGCSIQTHSDLARFVEGRLALLTANAGYGAVLVFGTLLIFLNWRVALWVGAGLATALGGTLALMQVTDITLNLLTMFGLIVVLGILVDDAIVVAENIQARHDRGESSLVAAIEGTREVFWPVVATVLTSVVAFLPLTFVKGNIGDLLGALPTVVACALLMSLIESLLILPSHMGHSLVHRDRKQAVGLAKPLHAFESWRDRLILQRVVPAYVRVLAKALQYRYISLCSALAVLIVSLGMFVGGRAEFEFLPTDDAETFVLSIRMPVGTSIARTSDVAERFERVARGQVETESVAAVIGQRTNLDSGTIDALASHLAELFIELKPVETRDRSSQQIIQAIRDEVGVVEDAERIQYQEISGGPVGADITLELRSADPVALTAAAVDVKHALARFTGVQDIFDDQSLGQRELRINLRPGAAALGFTVVDVAEQVRGALFGIDAHVFSSRREDIDVRVRLDESTRRDLHRMEQLWLVDARGRSVPLEEIAELVDGTSYATIKRIDRQRAITVTADVVPDLNPEQIAGAFGKNELPRIAAAHPSVELVFGGRQKQMRDAFSSLPYGFLAAMVMIYVILAWLFGSYIQPLAVMAAVPFATIGVIWGHMLLGYQLTFLSLIGFVALSGIVVNDSLIFMQFFNVRRADGLPLGEALLEAGRRRLRPIFLTTITTVLGLTPLMLEQSFQARFLIPMAISIAFGLISATVLILLVLPCIVMIVDDIRAIMYYLWCGQRRPESTPTPGSIMDGSA